MSIELDIPADKQRLLASYATKHSTTISSALRTNSVDGLVQSELYSTLQELINAGQIPEVLIAAAEASAVAAQAAKTAAAPK